MEAIQNGERVKIWKKVTKKIVVISRPSDNGVRVI